MVKRKPRSCPASLFPFQEKLLCSCDRALMCHPDSDVLPVCPPKRTSALRVNESTPRFPQFPRDPQVWLLPARKHSLESWLGGRTRLWPQRTRSVTLSDFSKKCAYGTPELGAGLATGGARGGPSILSSVALPHAATTLASKGLGAANRLIVACDTLKLRATSACASPFASLCMASRR